ncbi:MAG: aminotransferase class V-fold PLP-dependent enzyme [Clostridia bacterium]|nr:aminotransferase class V-fold PLP-dependent enzyme [Clostridia bacterium]
MSKLVYLDHAATSYPKPPTVMAAVSDCMKYCGGNPGRGSHPLAMGAASEIYSCREMAAEMFGAEPDRVIFTLNTTHALNLAIKGLAGRGKQGSGGFHVLCSDMEHNAVYRPLYRLAVEGIIDLEVFDTFPAAPVRTEDLILRSLTSRIRPDTRMVVCSHASNICSAILPIRRIGELCRRRGIHLVVDAAQSAGVYELDVDSMGITALCLPGHKGLMGPQGTGMLILGKGAALDTLMEGGNGVDSLRGEMSEDAPERYEAGTLQTPAIAGLRAGLEFVESAGIEAIREHERRLGAKLRDGLLEIPKVTVYAPHREGGVVLFSVEGYTSEEVGRILDGEGICVRAGFHCSALGHNTLQTPADGAVRGSLGWSSRERDVEGMLRVVRKL